MSNDAPEVKNPTKLRPLLDWRSALCDSDLSATQRHVCLTLSLYMSARGDSAFPGSTRLAHDTNLHVTTVKDALRASVDKGWLVVLQKGGSPTGGKRIATVYKANVPVDIDRGSEATGRPEWCDWGSTPRGPVVQDDPISSLNSSRTPAPSPDCKRCEGIGFFRNDKQVDIECDCRRPDLKVVSE
jgi:hypothetical protein